MPSSPLITGSGHTSSQGFTLIEIIFSLLLIAVLTLLLLRVGTTVLQVREKTKIATDVQQDLRYTLERITFAVRNSQQIIAADDRLLAIASGASLVPVVFTLTGGVLYVRNKPTDPPLQMTRPTVRIDQFLARVISSGGMVINILLQGSDTLNYAQHNSLLLRTSIKLRQ